MQKCDRRMRLSAPLWLNDARTLPFQLEGKHRLTRSRVKISIEYRYLDMRRRSPIKSSIRPHGLQEYALHDEQGT